MEFASNEYNRRQLDKMVHDLESFQASPTRLSALVNNLDGLLNSIENPPEDWFDAFQSEWGVLEQINADLIVDEVGELSGKNRSDIDSIFHKLRALLADALKDES